MSSIGIDFGTTNSSASSTIDGENRMLNVDSFADNPSVMKSVLLFSEEEKTVFAGEEAIQEYASDYMQGRFLRSIKKLLSSRTFQSTVISGKNMDCIAIISTFLSIFRDRCIGEMGAELDNKEI